MENLTVHAKEEELLNVNTIETSIGETPDAYVFYFNMAGIPEPMIKTTVTEGVLKVEGIRRSPFAGKFIWNNAHIEYGYFVRRIKLNGKANASNILKHYENGIFQVLIPKL